MTDEQKADLAIGAPIEFTYRNWRGETALRKAIPVRLWYGATDWHPEPQWLMAAIDCEKQAERDFALIDMTFARLADAVQPAAGEGGLRFGVAVTNIAASDVNPIKHGWYLRRVYRSGRMNGGAYIEYLTDDGRVHLTPPDNITRRSAPAFAALSTSAPAGVVGIKPLEWGDDYCAETPFGTYTVAEDTEDRWEWTFHRYPYGVPDDETHDTKQGAQAAVQADYETRIRACLITPPAQEPTR